MKKKRKPVRTIMLLIVFAVCVNASVNHLNVVGGALRQGIGLTARSCWGLCWRSC